MTAILSNEVIHMEIIVIALGLFVILCGVYVKIDRSGWNENSNPSENASISDERVDKLNFLLSKRYRDMHGRNYYTHKITFTFSDGFWYTSCKLILPNESYNIPPDPFSPQWSELRQKAINAHAKSLRKKSSPGNVRSKKLLINTLVIGLVALGACVLVQPVIQPVIDYFRGNAAIERGEYEKGIELLQKAQVFEAFRKNLYDAWLKFADHEIAEVMAAKEDYEAVRTRGQKLRTMDAQLRYCHALHAMSYDLSEVYPSGLTVEDAELDGYHITKLDTESQDRALDTSSVLVFRREQLDIPDDDADSVKYAVKLLPGSMFILDGDFAAKSFSEAKCIIIMDSVYVESGALLESSIPAGTGKYASDMNDYISRIRTRRLPYYAAVDSLTAYSKDNPSHGVVLMSSVNQPVCANENWVKEHSGIGRNYTITDSDRTGKFDRSIKPERIAPIIALFLMGGK